jgi:hypothetical protein
MFRPLGDNDAARPMRYLLLSLLCLAAAVAGCEKAAPPATTEAQPTPIAATAAPAAKPQSSPPAESGELSTGAVDACSLLTREEAASIIGEAVTNTQPSGKFDGGVDISQCYIAATTPANSVSLVVYQKAMRPGARDPKEMWEQAFEKEHPEREEEEEKGEKKKKPERIEGVGDAAFWIANPIGSVLYVLKTNSYLRISIGGAADQATKLEKSKAIAQLALKRL